jgi:hypothetical protein
VKLPLGRTFVSPAFDLLLVGGGLSLMVLGYLSVYPESAFLGAVQKNAWLLVWLSNSAHFAGSTVRLYTKPGSFETTPFATMGLPIVTLAVLGFGLLWPEPIGQSLQALYLTWSPYHYAAQSYGLAVMYAYRSGGLGDRQKSLLRFTAMLPFLYMFLSSDGAGLAWLLPGSVLSQPDAAQARVAISRLALGGGLALPAIAYGLSLRPGARRLPLISLSALVANSVWLTLLSQRPALIGLVTVFHGIQYLAILTIFHARERRRLDPEGPSGLVHGLRFYAVCLGLGYLLFQVWPWAGVLVGFGYAESVIVSAAVVNIHHFVVDGYIWRLRGDRNYATVDEASPVAA